MAALSPSSSLRPMMLTLPSKFSALKKGSTLRCSSNWDLYDKISRRIQATRLRFRETDHGYSKSIYTASPDGLKVEFMIDHSEVEQINEMRRRDCPVGLERWLAPSPQQPRTSLIKNLV